MGEVKKIGIMTGGGDCPGLNAAIRATAKAAFRLDYEVIGFRDGWAGLIDKKYEILDGIKTSGIIDRGGTILGASRTSPLKVENGPEKVLETFNELGLRALVVLGGEGTLTVTSRMYDKGLPVIGIPKTIDNDVEETDYAIGFQTAVQIATDALDRLRSTAASHHRVMVLEVMGRRAGWIATYAGMANGADAILIPEVPLDGNNVDTLCKIVESRSKTGMNFSIVVVAEGTALEGTPVYKPVSNQGGVIDKDRFGGVGKVLGEIIENKTGLETRVSSLDYIQRGGTPVAYDRSLATAFGVKAVDLIERGRFGMMTALKGNRIIGVPLKKMEGRTKTVNLNIYNTAKIFFG